MMTLSARLRATLLPLAGLLVPSVAATPQAPARPRLVVIVVVDQMRADYLDRFGSIFHGGLARLVREGTVFTEARHDHAGTETAPGHATIATGTYPSHSGMVANNWYDRSEARAVYAVDDSTAIISGRPRDAGRSPKRLLTDALGDWLKRASPQSHVLSVAIKDRAAILMGGHRPDAVYWYNSTNGQYQTSSYYANQSPAWLDSFNLARPANRHLKDGWTLLLTPDAYGASGPDSVPQEDEGNHVTFPHLLDTTFTGSLAASYAELPYTPFGDELTLDLARSAVMSEGLGADTIPDLLWVGCSAGDYVGHRYGPSSREIEDYYLRLDSYLGDFLAFLDQRVGRGRYAVALTGDHGVLPMPEELARSGVPAKRLLKSEASAAFQRAESDLSRDLGVSRPLFAGYLEGFLLRFSAAAAKGVMAAQLEQGVAARLRQIPFIADVFTADELVTGTGGGRDYFEQFQHSYYAGRSPDLLIRYQPYVLFTNSDSEHGTSHFTPYDYDTHVPLVFFGAGLAPGRRGERVKTVDIAPTLARLLAITPPVEVDGHALGATAK